MKASAIYISVLLFVFAVFASLPFIKVPITASARGTMRSADENISLVSLVSGRVVQNNLTRNNQIIQQGDTLLVITTAGLQAKKSNQNLLALEHKEQLADLSNLLAHRFDQLKTGQYRQELFAMQGKIAEVEAQLNLAARDLERNKQLYERRVISQAEFDKSQYAYEQLRGQKRTIAEQQMAVWQGKKRELEQRLLTLQGEQEVLDVEQDNYVIKAATSGRLTNFKGITEGAYLVQGQQLGEIAPEQDLIAECLVAPKDIGFIHLKQDVRLQIDSYNYNQWGMVNAVVTDIDQNVIVDAKTGLSFFKVRCTLKQTYLTLNNGYKAEIGKGSSFSARFHLLERSLWQLIFDRADDWFNPALGTNR